MSPPAQHQWPEPASSAATRQLVPESLHGAERTGPSITSQTS